MGLSVGRRTWSLACDEGRGRQVGSVPCGMVSSQRSTSTGASTVLVHKVSVECEYSTKTWNALSMTEYQYKYSHAITPRLGLSSILCAPCSYLSLSRRGSERLPAQNPPEVPADRPPPPTRTQRGAPSRCPAIPSSRPLSRNGWATSMLPARKGGSRRL